ncbi:MAG: aspartate dehydrogenase [Eubacterium sp.]|nr:aspartate dehydrogenase [Eubacterium sp.]
MFFKKKDLEKQKKYDPDKKEPIIKASICNGEQVAGFKDLETGEFHEVMYLKDARDLEVFKDKYGITEDIKKIY